MIDSNRLRDLPFFRDIIVGERSSSILLKLCRTVGVEGRIELSIDA